MEPLSKLFMALSVVVVAGVAIIGGIILFNSFGNDDADAVDYSGWEKTVSDLDTYGGSVSYDGRFPGSYIDPNHASYSVSKDTVVTLKGDVIFFTKDSSVLCIPISHICAVSYGITAS